MINGTHIQPRNILGFCKPAAPPPQRGFCGYPYDRNPKSQIQIPDDHGRTFLKVCTFRSHASPATYPPQKQQLSPELFKDVRLPRHSSSTDPIVSLLTRFSMVTGPKQARWRRALDRECELVVFTVSVLGREARANPCSAHRS
jgi:hypothetical protein